MNNVLSNTFPTGNGRQHIEEIDALRGIAVILVLLYHAFPQTLPGGFIGVDVFFVISGFVISRSYLYPLINQEISFRQFYVARLRRLTPAIFVVGVLTAAVAALVLLPDRLIALSWSLVAQVVYLQNLVFWVEGDYFSGALTKPLLHTWSLAIEEQFYILWVVVILFFKRFPGSIVITLLAATIGSLAIGFFLENRSPKTVFFLLPFRVWEFSAGMLAYLATRRELRLPDVTREIAPSVCIAVIVATAWGFDEGSSFPGPQSLIACAATAIALMLVATQPKSGSLFKAQPLLYAGKISYSLYLWHWPPLVLFYLHAGHAASGMTALVLMLLATGGAVVSHHLIEQPIRRRATFPSDAVFLTAIAGGLGALVLISVGLVQTQGLLFRYPSEVRPFFAASQERGGFRCGQAFVLRNPSSEFCQLSNQSGKVKSSVLILGDSHSDVLKELIADVGQKNGLGVYLTTRNCDLGRFGTLNFCNKRVLEKLITQAKNANVTDIIAISYWETGKFSETSLQSDLERLSQSGFRVHVFASIPSDDSYDPRKRAVKFLEGGPLDYSGISLAEHRKNTAAESRIFNASIQKSSKVVRLIDPSVYFCNSGSCTWQSNGVPYYLDTNHLTFTGGEVLRPLFNELFKTIAAAA